MAQMATVQVGTEQRRCVPFTVSDDLVERPSELRARAREDGYVFIRGLVPEDAIGRLRSDITAILDEVGWLDAGTDPLDAVSTQQARIIGTPEFNPIYDTIQKLESFHTMAHDPALLRVAEALLGAPGDATAEHHRPGPVPEQAGVHHAPAPGLHPGAGHARGVDRVDPAGALSGAARRAGGAARVA